METAHQRKRTLQQEQMSFRFKEKIKSQSVVSEDEQVQLQCILGIWLCVFMGLQWFPPHTSGDQINDRIVSIDADSAGLPLHLLEFC